MFEGEMFLKEKYVFGVKVQNSNYAYFNWFLKKQ